MTQSYGDNSWLTLNDYYVKSEVLPLAYNSSNSQVMVVSIVRYTWHACIGSPYPRPFACSTNKCQLSSFSSRIHTSYRHNLYIKPFFFSDYHFCSHLLSNSLKRLDLFSLKAPSFSEDNLCSIFHFSKKKNECVYFVIFFRWKFHLELFL